MKLHDKNGIRLNTKNFKRVDSEAVVSIDYNEKLRIIEIEFTNRKIFHYLSVKKSEWKEMISIINNKESLGTHINRVFKKPYNKGERDYYELIVEPEFIND
jgi:hypothetical protein